MTSFKPQYGNLPTGFGLRPTGSQSPYSLPDGHRPKTPLSSLASILSGGLTGGVRNFQLGELADGKPAVNTAQVDGSSDFLNKLSGFGENLLKSIGGRPEKETSMVQPASFGGGGGGGVDMRMIAMVGLAGAVVYYATKS